MDIGVMLIKVLVFAPPIIVAVILHEVAHGWVAEKFGDDTARRAGRITLNPISHVDLVGTVLLPLILVATGSRILFGWAKPVPVNFGRLRDPKRDMMWVALSGPGTNLLLGIISALLVRVVVMVNPVAVSYAQSDLNLETLGRMGLPLAVLVLVMMMLNSSIIINAILMVLNLTPIPPLDGSRVVSGLLPESAARSYAKLEQFGIFIVLGLLFFFPPAQRLFMAVIIQFVKLFYLIALL